MKTSEVLIATTTTEVSLIDALHALCPVVFQNKTLEGSFYANADAVNAKQCQIPRYAYGI